MRVIRLSKSSLYGALSSKRDLFLPSFHFKKDQIRVKIHGDFFDGVQPHAHQVNDGND